jgi:hypothetical protein
MSVKYKERVSTSVIAGFLGISTQAFNDLVGRGVVPRGGREGYPLRSTVAAFCEHWWRQAAGRGELGQEHVLSAARAQREQATAKLIELRLQRAQGDVLDAREAEFAFGELMIQLRSDLMWQIPANAAQIMMSYGAPPEVASTVQESVDNIVRQVLSDFADDVSRVTHPGKPRHRSTNGGDAAAPTVRALVDGDV